MNIQVSVDIRGTIWGDIDLQWHLKQSFLSHYIHLDDYNLRTCDMTPRFQPFTEITKHNNQQYWNKNVEPKIIFLIGIRGVLQHLSLFIMSS